MEIEKNRKIVNKNSSLSRRNRRIMRGVKKQIKERGRTEKKRRNMVNESTKKKRKDKGKTKKKKNNRMQKIDIRIVKRQNRGKIMA